jgi:hypothetical protein
LALFSDLGNTLVYLILAHRVVLDYLGGMANVDPRSGVPHLGVERMATIEIDHFLLQRLRCEARKRDLPVAALVRMLLDTIIDDKLIAAILD